MRDRWANFWVVLIGIAESCSMLGRFTCLFDYAHRVPILGSSREPVRFFICGHRWESPRWRRSESSGLGRPGDVSLRQGLILAGMLVVLSIPILCVLYAPAWSSSEPLEQATEPGSISLARP